VCDSSKFARVAFGAVCPLERIDIVVTDAGIPPQQREALTAVDVTVHVV
jgi:DeoR/GlpR family transcriptional regulator of sugar metabolism